MRKSLWVIFGVILYFTVFYSPAFVFSETIIFDSDGSIIDKVQYEIVASDREKSLSMQLINGYDVKSHAWKDPIKLRKKRIEQWKIMRSLYNPDSLPAKIENATVKDKL